jgi:uncharacterized protein
MANISQPAQGLAKVLNRLPRSAVLCTPDEYGQTYEDITFPSMGVIPQEPWRTSSPGSGKLVIANHPMSVTRYGFLGAGPLPRGRQLSASGGTDFEVNYVPDNRYLLEAPILSIRHNVCPQRGLVLVRARDP